MKTPRTPTPPTFSKNGDPAIPFQDLDDSQFQSQLLQRVSRTFALTIPLLPASLEFSVGNAYLLCRIIDTIEDDPALDAEQTAQFCRRFVAVVDGEEHPDLFAADLLPLLSEATGPDEVELIRHAKRVIDIYLGLPKTPRNSIGRCVRIMSEGMIHFQENRSPGGLPGLSQLNHYCYVVAGVVGEMLTDLFCHYSEATASHYQQLKALAPSFGQGLQMTNIIKDTWEDWRRGFCWLPRDIFAQFNFDPKDLDEQQHSGNFEKGLERLIGITHGHLANAFRYTLLISKRDKGIRRFCLLALGLALLTLRKVDANRQFTRSNEVKISRRQVKQVYGATSISASFDPVLKALFSYASRGLPFHHVAATEETG